MALQGVASVESHRCPKISELAPFGGLEGDRPLFSVCLASLGQLFFPKTRVGRKLRNHNNSRWRLVVKTIAKNHLHQILPGLTGGSFDDEAFRATYATASNSEDVSGSDHTLGRNTKDIRVHTFIEDHGVLHQHGFDGVNPVAHLRGSLEVERGSSSVHGRREVLNYTFIVSRHETSQ